MFTLAMLLKKGDKGIARDVERASYLFQCLRREASWEYPHFKFRAWNRVEREAREQTEFFIEYILKGAMVKPRCYFLLILGGTGSGKTSVARSLNRAEFVDYHKETELYDLKRIVVTTEEEPASRSHLTQLIQDSETLFAALTRLRVIGDITRAVRKLQPTLEGEKLVEVAQLESGQSVNMSGKNAQKVSQPELGQTVYMLGKNPQKVSLDNLSCPSCLSTGRPPSECSRRNIRETLENIRQQVIFNARIALTTNSFPRVRNCALVQCWDAGGQHQYMMAHPLFVRRASILMFVINLKDLANIEKRCEEVEVLCEWMELAHALVVEPGKVRVIIMGTRKGEYGDEKGAWAFLEDRLVEDLGTECYNSWI